jgi:hypothetical protein
MVSLLQEVQVVVVAVELRSFLLGLESVCLQAQA